jgi:hypothetical protein
MSEQLAPDTKKCPYCGRITSTKSNFCYYCARELVARPEHPAEEAKPRRVNWLVLGIILAVVVVILLFIVLR